MNTRAKHSGKTSWFFYLKAGVLACCFSLMLLVLATPSVFASSHAAQNAAATGDSDIQPKLSNVISLGLAGPGGVAMVNKQVGWALTGALQRTSNGGKTWQTVAQSSAQEELSSVYVLNGQVAWYETYDTQTAATGALYRTNDGGQTWTRFAWPDPSLAMNSISVFNGQYAWVTAADNSGENVTFDLFLVGGSTQAWQQVTSPGQYGASNAYFISQKVGWATSVSADGSTTTLYTTRNGGQSWTEQDLQMPAGVPTTAVLANLQFLGFGTQLEGYLTARFGDPTTYEQYATQIYRTEDGGKTWLAYGDAQPTFQVIQIDQWHVVRATTAFVAIGGQEQLASLQAGTWTIQNVTLPADPNGSPFFTVLSSEIMFASTDTTDYTGQILYRSTDGGATWQQVATLPNS